MSGTATVLRREAATKMTPTTIATPATPVYDLHPAHLLPSRSLGQGFAELAQQLAGKSAIRLDGVIGVNWEGFRSRLDAELRRLDVSPDWVDVQSAMKSPEAIDALVEPFLGGDDPLFGTRFTGELGDFFDRERLSALHPVNGRTAIFYGSGAALVDSQGPLVFVDVPKNEIQYRSRAGKVVNLGATRSMDAKAQYKRLYFVDWVVLNRHIANIAGRVDLIVDDQKPDLPVFINGQMLRDALRDMSHSVFRVRPWFEAGPWGGQWMKNHLAPSPTDVPNLAWSFELIVPENGLVLSDGQRTFEIAFEWMMVQDHGAVLGDFADWFGHEFPIRFDFLDTVDGGNLSLQCHPRPDYITEHFGETFTQDETYYILDCTPQAEVFLGFRAGIDPNDFRKALERSIHENVPVDVESFVNALPASRHDLFLIPHGTIHCSGKGNLVLEISATPYIFTFKMYDWLRMDLHGKPRPLNIERAFRNLNFERQGARVEQELVSRPVEIASGSDWQLIHVPTHADHFYDVHRFEFDTEVDVQTDGSPHVLMVVEGTSIAIQTAGQERVFNFAETFVVPAAAESYRLINRGAGRVKVVKAFMKPTGEWPEWMHHRRKASTTPHR